MNPVDALMEDLRRAIRSSRYTQGQIAQAAGISEKHLSMFMQRRTDPSPAVLRKLCDSLGLDWELAK